MTTLCGDSTRSAGTGRPDLARSGREHPAQPAQPHPADPPTFDDVAGTPVRTAVPRAWLPARRSEDGSGTPAAYPTPASDQDVAEAVAGADREAARARRDRLLATVFCVTALLVVVGTLIVVTGSWTYALLGVLCLTVIARVLAAVPLARRPRRPGQ